MGDGPDSSIVRLSHRQHTLYTCIVCDVRGIFYFQIYGLNIEIHTLQSDSNNVSIYLIFFFPQFYAKVSDYQAVGLSIHRTIDTHPWEMLKKFCLTTMQFTRIFSIRTRVIVIAYCARYKM